MQTVGENPTKLHQEKEMNIIEIDEPPAAEEITTTTNEDDPYACSKEREAMCDLPDGGHVLPPLWLRRGVQNALRHDKFLLDYNLHFLPYLGSFLWVVFLLVQVF